MKRMYQYISIPGLHLRYEGSGRDKSRFWDKGKWDNFIKPLIPEDSIGLPFLEIGSNSGLLLSLAEQSGFRHVIGIEQHKDRVLTADLYRDSIGGYYKTIHGSVGVAFDWSQLPLTGITLIANTHYYLSVADFNAVVQSLCDRTLYCIVVSEEGHIKKSGKAGPSLQDILPYFKGWKMIGKIDGVPTDGDPSPRPGLFSIIFKSNLIPHDTDVLLQKESNSIFTRQGFTEKQNVLHPIVAAGIDFYTKVVSDDGCDPKDTALYAFYLERQGETKANATILQKKDLALDIMHHGIKRLIFYNRWVSIVDGFNRLMIAKALGYKNVIIKKL